MSLHITEKGGGTFKQRLAKSDSTTISVDYIVSILGFQLVYSEINVESEGMVGTISCLLFEM